MNFTIHRHCIEIVNDHKLFYTWKTFNYELFEFRHYFSRNILSCRDSISSFAVKYYFVWSVTIIRPALWSLNTAARIKTNPSD